MIKPPKIQIKYFDFQNDCTYVLASKRNTGKSVLAKEIIYYLTKKFDYHFIVVISKTANYTDDWNFLNNQLFFDDDNLDKTINKVFDYQKKKGNTRKNPNAKHGIILLDDLQIMSNNRSNMLSNIFTLGRHFCLTIIMLVQYPKFILNSAIRNNIDYLFFSEVTQNALNCLYETIYTDMNKKQFYKFVNQNNNDYQFIFQDNKTKDKTKRFNIVKANLLDILKQQK